MVWKTGQQQHTGPAAGVDLPNGRKQVVVKMDGDQFDFIRKRAIRENTSVAEQIRNLIEWGIESTGEEEQSHG